MSKHAGYNDTMGAADSFDLARLFRSVQMVMEAQRQIFNQSDEINCNHGDHMVEIFNIAARSTGEQGGVELPVAMDYAGLRLSDCKGNGSAQVYARGLTVLAEQFRKYGINLEDLLAYVQGVIWEKSDVQPPANQTKSGDVLKALLAGLAAWQGSEVEGIKSPAGLSLGYLFDLGVAYMQAKGVGGSRVEVIAEAAVAVSPLKDVPHRRMSGKAAIIALLESMAKQRYSSTG